MSQDKIKEENLKDQKPKEEVAIKEHVKDEKKSGKDKGAKKTGTTFFNLIDLALGGADGVEINFSMLYALINGIIFKLNLTLEEAAVDPDLLEKAKFVALNRSDKQPSCVASMKDRVVVLEQYWEEMQRLITKEDVKARDAVTAGIPGANPVKEVWQAAKLAQSVEINRDNINKLMAMVEDLTKVTSEMKSFNDDMKEALGMDEKSPEGPAAQSKKLKESMAKLTEVTAQFAEQKELLSEALKRLGHTHLPSDAWFESVPTWPAIEQLIDGKFDPLLPGEDRRKEGLCPPSTELITTMESLGEMIRYYPDLMQRIKDLENRVKDTIDRGATKADMQKLLIKMAEVQGIAGAVDRLLCRIQGAEDQICCVRQIVNKIYGCVTQNASGDQATAILACLGAPASGTQSTGNRNNLEIEEQVRSMTNQLTKIQCELDTVRRNVSNVDGVKVDVQSLFSIVNELDENKLDKCILATELAQKADKCSVDDKVSQSSFELTCEGLNSVINDILSKILESDTEWQKITNYLTSQLESKCERDEVDGLRDQVETKMRCMARRLVTLQRSAESINESGEVGATKK